MNELVLLTAHDCHLCAHGREVLDELAAEVHLSWREVDANSDEGSALAASAPPLRPVLYDAESQVLAYGRLSAKRLRRQLARAGPPVRRDRPCHYPRSWRERADPDHRRRAVGA